MKNVLITGATGFLGGWLVKHLLDRKYNVSVIRNPNSSIRTDTTSQYGLEDLGSKCTELMIDLGNELQVTDLVRKTKPDVVIHMAAIGDITLCAENPSLAYRTSAISTLNLLEAIRINAPDTLFLSHTTDKVYSGNETPFTEDMSLRPSHIYEVAKVSQEHLTRTYAKNYDLKTITIRCGNYFGGYDFNFSRIIPYAIKQNLNNEVIELRSNGSFTRDFLYIEDAVLVNQILIDLHFNDLIDFYGDAFNFSLEINLSVHKIIELICEIMEKRPLITINDGANTEIPDMQLDCRKSRTKLGWERKFGLEEGLDKTIHFYRDYFNG